MRLRNMWAGVACGAVLAVAGGFAVEEVVDRAEGQARFSVSAGQLRINQSISSAAVRRSNRALNYLAPIRTAQTDGADDGSNGVRPLAQVAGAGQGWTGAQIADGAITEAKLADGAVTAAKLAAPEAWRTVGAAGQPAFRGGAQNRRPPYICSSPEPQPPGCPTYYPVGFYKDPLGVVHLRGSFALGNDTIAFQLPPGYRTSQGAAFPILVSTGAQARLVIYGAGFVQISQVGGFSGDEVYSLDGMTFRADA